MDLPVHLTMGALVGETILYLDAKTTPATSSPSVRRHWAKLAVASLSWGVLSHLFLDALPYYDWVFNIPIFSDWPNRWLWRQVVVTVPIFGMILYMARTHPLMACVAMFGGVYPDIEKLLYFDGWISERFVLFPWHSTTLSGTAWEHEHRLFLSIAETLLFFGMMGLIYWFTHRQTSTGETCPLLYPENKMRQHL